MSTTEPHTRDVQASTLSDTGSQRAEPLIAQQLADNLAFELRAADAVIRAMLNVLTTKQKLHLAAQLEMAGLSPDGMTRAHERHDELCRYDAMQQRLRHARQSLADSSNPPRPA